MKRINKNVKIKARTTLPDRDNPIWTARDFEKAKNFDELPKSMQDGLRSIARRGRPRKAAPKKQISLRLDAGLVDHLRETSGYNMRVETMLIKAWKESRI